MTIMDKAEDNSDPLNNPHKSSDAENSNLIELIKIYGENYKSIAKVLKV